MGTAWFICHTFGTTSSSMDPLSIAVGAITLLGAVKSIQERIGKNPSGKATGLDLQLTQLSTKLEEFEELLRDHTPCAVPTHFGVDRPHLGRGVAGQRSESANKARAELNVLRLSLTASLGAVPLWVVLIFPIF